MQYQLKPASEWADQDPSIFSTAYRGTWTTPEVRSAFIHVYDSREEALLAAAQANLYPTVETYGPGLTTIRVAPPPIGIENHTLTTRHHRGRTSGLYVQRYSIDVLLDETTM